MRLYIANILEHLHAVCFPMPLSGSYARVLIAAAAASGLLLAAASGLLLAAATCYWTL